MRDSRLDDEVVQGEIPPIFLNFVTVNISAQSGIGKLVIV
jgi:hypothetical protein